MTKYQAVVNSKFGKCFLFVIRVFIGAIFVYSSLGKIVRPSDFADAVLHYRILPIEMVNIFAICLPWVELLCGLSLINGKSQRSGALIAAVLNLMFIFAAVSALARGLDIECGCKTIAGSGKVGWWLVVRDFFFFALCLPIIFHRYNGSSSPSIK